MQTAGLPESTEWSLLPESGASPLEANRAGDLTLGDTSIPTHETFRGFVETDQFVLVQRPETDAEFLLLRTDSTVWDIRRHQDGSVLPRKWESRLHNGDYGTFGVYGLRLGLAWFSSFTRIKELPKSKSVVDLWRTFTTTSNPEATLKTCELLRAQNSTVGEIAHLVEHGVPFSEIVAQGERLIVEQKEDGFVRIGYGRLRSELARECLPTVPFSENIYLLPHGKYLVTGEDELGDYFGNHGLGSLKNFVFFQERPGSPIRLLPRSSETEMTATTLVYWAGRWIVKMQLIKKRRFRKPVVTPIT